MSTDQIEPRDFGALSAQCRDLLRVVHHLEKEGEIPTGERIKTRIKRQYPDGLNDLYGRLNALEEQGLIHKQWHTGKRKIWYCSDRGKVTIGRLKSLYDR